LRPQPPPSHYSDPTRVVESNFSWGYTFINKFKKRRALIKQPAVYILASQKGGTLYIGVTSDLIQRVWLHRQGCVSSFTKKYHVNQLVYFELCSDINAAIIREKQLKKWNRLWKIRLIEQTNPNWNDLWSEIVGV
jgi:putative endonuclease